MNRSPLTLGAVAVVMVLANTMLAHGVPDVLDNMGVPMMPFGLRESHSPTGTAGAHFVDVTAATGIDHTRYSWESGKLPYVAVIGGGVAAGDVDRDGLVDLYFPPGGPDHPAHLYRNLGDLRFEDVTETAGLHATGFGTGATFGDYDNDGDADLYTFIDERGVLYVNDGNGTFSDHAASAGVDLDGACGSRPCQASSMAWFDHDLDGDLDLYVVNNLDWRDPRLHTSGEDYASLIYFAGAQVSLLFENQGPSETGAWTFADVTDEAGVHNDGGKGLGVAVFDVDRDGDLDLATANDITRNALYVNQGDGAYRNEARTRAASEVKTSMGIMAGDVDGDLDPDLVISNFRGDKLSLLLQGDDGGFRYATEARGLGASYRGTGWGVTLFDHDLDGWLDIGLAVGRAVPHKPNELHNIIFEDLLPDREDQLFRNRGHGQFEEVTASAGDLAGATTTRALLAVDLDNDGDEDLVRVNLQGQPAEVLRNDLVPAHHSIQLTFEGQTGNRDGYGARVEAKLPDGRVLVREHTSSAGYQTGLGPVMTIGLGDVLSAEITVHWPGGLTSEYGTLAAARHHLVEPATP